ncbi:MAG: GNAT family N-acetyltransferase [Parvibaculum sp.]|nr:GNAT family N-acetyltransferase [Parvibaculum sp.]
MTTLTTERLILRPWRAEDFEPFAAMSADPKVMEHFPSTLTRADSDNVASILKTDIEIMGYGFWALEVPGEAAFIGFVGIRPVTFEAHFVPAVEIGWRLAPAHWGKGYATEAARAALAHGFGALGLTEIVSFTTTMNLRSQTVMQRIGMTHDETDDFDHPALAEGHRLKRHVLYRLRAEDWGKQI